MFYKIDKKYFWVSENLTIDQTVDTLIKRISTPYKKIEREKIYQLVVNNRK